MKFLLDEMLPPRTARELAARGHEAWTVADVGLDGATDERVFDHAIVEGLVLISENVGDFARLLAERAAQAQTATPVVFVRKAKWPPRADLASAFARRLDEWAHAHPDPFAGAHWLAPHAAKE